MSVSVAREHCAACFRINRISRYIKKFLYPHVPVISGYPLNFFAPIIKEMKGFALDIIVDVNG